MPESHAKHGPSSLRYKEICPALAEKALMIPKNQGWDLPANLDPKAISDPAQLSVVLKIAPLIEQWAKDCREAGLNMARNGVEIPGFTLRSRSGKRVVKDLLPAWAILNEEFGLDLEDFLPACSIKITEIETAVKAKAEKGKGAEQLRKLNSRFAEDGIVTTSAEVEYLQKNKE